MSDPSKKFMRLAETILRVLAFDLPGYRFLFAKVGGAIAALILQKDSFGYAGRLRAFTYHQSDGTRPYFVGPNVVMVERSRIHLSEGVKLYGFNFLHAGTSGYIRIGKNTHIDVKSVLYGQGGLSIGEYCAIASGVIIYSQSNQYQAMPGERIIDQPVKYAPVEIGSDVWIGAGAIILPGVTIGDCAVIGAGAVVTTDVKKGEVVAGIPARAVGHRDVVEVS